MNKYEIKWRPNKELKTMWEVYQLFNIGDKTLMGNAKHFKLYDMNAEDIKGNLVIECDHEWIEFDKDGIVHFGVRT